MHEQGAGWREENYSCRVPSRLNQRGGSRRQGDREGAQLTRSPFALAAENVLFTEHRVLKLADFGLAIDLNEERAVTRAGTLDYMAPEVRAASTGGGR